MKLRVGVIFGGRSGEHEIALRSARTVIEQIDKDKYEVVPIAIDRSGGWLSPASSLALLPEPTREISLERFGEPLDEQIILAGDSTFQGLETSGGGQVPLDVIFPVLHGTYGEDGTIQGLLE